MACIDILFLKENQELVKQVYFTTVYRCDQGNYWFTLHISMALCVVYDTNNIVSRINKNTHTANSSAVNKDWSPVNYCQSLFFDHPCLMIIVTGGFSKKSSFVIIFRSKCPSKQVFLETLQCSQENIESLFNKLFQPCLKWGFDTDVFMRILQNFYKQLFL